MVAEPLRRKCVLERSSPSVHAAVVPKSSALVVVRHSKHACVARLTFLKPSLADAEKDQTSVKPNA